MINCHRDLLQKLATETYLNEPKKYLVALTKLGKYESFSVSIKEQCVTMDHLLTNETHDIFIQTFPNKTYMQEKKS